MITEYHLFRMYIIVNHQWKENLELILPLNFQNRKAEHIIFEYYEIIQLIYKKLNEILNYYFIFLFTDKTSSILSYTTPVAPVITDITLCYIFHISCIPISRYLYFFSFQVLFILRENHFSLISEHFLSSSG